MLNRRSFFKSLGAAVLGTAIALRLPDSIIPITKIPEPNKVPVPTFKQLNELYESCRQYGEEPEYIIFSVDMLNAVEDMIDSNIIRYDNWPRDIRPDENMNFYKFKGAKLKAYSFYSDEMVSCGGGTKYGSNGRLNLLTGKII